MKKDRVIIDIDGCLNHYPDPLKMWAEMMLNIDESVSREAIEHKNDFDLLKKTYRHSSILSYLLPRDGAKEVLQKIKKSGYSIILLTARNPKKNPSIKTITKNWLHKYGILFDSIVFTKDKNTHIKQHEDRIIMVVEDYHKILDSFGKLKTEIVVFNNYLNGDAPRSHFHAVSSWKEIDSLFKNLVTK